ncbi:MAG: hypothetical protein ACYC7J_02615 [Syntrophales bacterium]
MTKNMLIKLRVIYKTEGQSGYVHMKTAYALEKIELVQVSRIPDKQRTQGGNFPQYWASLTQKGITFCEKKFH